MNSMLIIRSDIAMEHADRIIVDKDEKVWNFFFDDGTPPPLIDLTVFEGVTREEVNKAMQNMFGW